MRDKNKIRRWVCLRMDYDGDYGWCAINRVLFAAQRERDQGNIVMDVCLDEEIRTSASKVNEK